MHTQHTNINIFLIHDTTHRIKPNVTNVHHIFIQKYYMFIGGYKFIYLSSIM